MHAEKMITAEYARFSEESNALDYLEKAVEFIRRVDTNPTDWKWVILSLHGALYGFMVCALKGTDPDRVAFKDKNGKRRLISFAKALEWCQEPNRMNMTTESKTLCLSEDQKRSLDLVQEQFRNAFVHYQPCLWFIELHGMPGVVIDGLKVVRFLSLETGNYMHLTVEQCKHIETLVREGSDILQHTRLFLEAQGRA